MPDRPAAQLPEHSGLLRPGTWGFPQAMRLVAWPGKPAVRFTVLRALRSP
jgi:hypothetical protein